MKMDVKEVMAENDRRVKAAMEQERARVIPPEAGLGEELSRFRDDFELWAARCVRIRHKITGEMVPFILNRPQRVVLAELERQRRLERPIRLILLKSRQWGGSTLVQMYMAWIQMIHRTNWHSLICAHVKDTSAQIRNMYATMLDNYPERYWPDGIKPVFQGFERSINTRLIGSRGCKVTLASSESQDSARGSDYSMVHLSEVAFWKSGDRHSPDDFVRAVCSGVPLTPYTLIVIESTANGVGNYFHNEWLRAASGESAFVPVFIPWYYIGHNSLTTVSPTRLLERLDDYERRLWDAGGGVLTLDQLNWYHNKRREYQSHASMKAEFPSTAIEAFVNSGAQVFATDRVEALRQHCGDPVEVGELQGRGDRGPMSLTGIRFVADRATGKLKVWHHPVEGERYMAVVDVGGRSASSDYSVIAVMRCRDESHPVAEVVAQWRGHDDHDIVAWRAARVATYYHNARLVIESNTFETEAGCDSDAGYILLQLRQAYSNLYHRVVTDASAAVRSRRIGFHTNRATKQMIVHNLIASVRDGGFVEHDNEACNELMTYERRQNGSYGAKPGYHDDILMTRAIGLFVMEIAGDEGPDRQLTDFFRNDGGIYQ